MCVESSRMCRSGAPCTDCLSGSPGPGAGGIIGPGLELREHDAPRRAADGEPLACEELSGASTPAAPAPANGEIVAEPTLSETAPAPAPAPVLRARRERGVRTARMDRHNHSNRPQQLDLLARATAHFRTCLLHADLLIESCRRSQYYEVLTRLTQPAHIVAFMGVTLLAVLLLPSHRQPHSHQEADALPWTSLAYVLSFAAHFGSQFWMTFVSGLSLFFSLPRHHFAEVQKVLFPLYFTINSFLSLVTLASFLRLSQRDGAEWGGRLALQVLGMAACFLLELGVRLYLTPPMIRLIISKTNIEKSVKGVGVEVGHYDLGPLSNCPHYLKIHAAFRRVHTQVAMANILTMACTAFHAHYLASKICLV